MMVRGIRGATSVTENTREAILEATAELLEAVVESNEIDRGDVVSAFFNAEYPAVAARAAGWTDVPLLCGHEMNVPGGLPRCLRLLIHVNSDRALSEINHVYLREAVRLRPDIAGNDG